MHALDNPVWQSLNTRHATMARRHGAAARYPAEIAPFAAIDPEVGGAADDLAALVPVGETVLFVGPIPELDSRWSVHGPEPISQMVCQAPTPTRPGGDIVELSAAHLSDVLALIALVYPHYFRPGTPTMGRYIGIYDGPQLAAMAGERMGFDGYQEISAVCTHPAHTGRGHAHRLVAELGNASFQAGRQPFLHVSPENARAKALYERLGYLTRTDISLWSVRRLSE